MSRIGRLPIVVPPSVQISVDGSTVNVKGPKGQMAFAFNPVLFIRRAAVDNSPARAAAVIMLAVGLHFDETLAHAPNDIPGFFM